MSQTVSNVSSAAYSRQFGIAFSSSSPSALNTLAGACPLEDDARCTDSCGSPHHKHVKANAEILHNMAGNGNNKVVYWADRLTSAYCQHRFETVLEDTEEICEKFAPESACAAVYREEYRNAIQFLHFPIDEEDAAAYEAFMGITLIHETAHTLNLPDTYANLVRDDPVEHLERGYQCVMEIYLGRDYLVSYYNEIKNGKNPFCDYCAGLLEDLI